jgi:hypothetical protein
MPSTPAFDAQGDALLHGGSRYDGSEQYYRCASIRRWRHRAPQKRAQQIGRHSIRNSAGVVPTTVPIVDRPELTTRVSIPPRGHRRLRNSDDVRLPREVSAEADMIPAQPMAGSFHFSSRRPVMNTRPA